jgi:predicted transcriptional regulator
MAARVLKEVMQKIESWPEEAQEELAAIAQEMDEALRGGIYHASQDELAGIDRGLKAAREGRFAKDADVEAALSKRRP